MRPRRRGERRRARHLRARRHVATITYSRPEKLNAIDGAMRDGLNEAFARFRADDEAWVRIVTGEGGAFCVGADAGGEGNRPATSPARSGNGRR